MSKEANYCRIGMFVLVSIALIILFTIILSSQALMKNKAIVETYFDESVQGLDVGSAVKFRGVKIGQVDSIQFVDDVYKTEKLYVLVRINIPTTDHPEEVIEDRQIILKNEIKKGLRLRLTSAGLTGTAYLEADFLNPERYPPIEIDWKPKHLYVPSAPSMRTEIGDSLEKVLTTFENTKIDDISHHLDELVVEMNSLMKDQVGPTLDNLDRRTDVITADISALSSTANGIIETNLAPLLLNAQQASEGLPETVDRMNSTLKRIEYLVEDQQANLQEAMNNFESASRDLKQFTDMIKDYPSMIFFGDPPPQTEP